MVEKGEIALNVHFFHNFFYAICFLKFLNTMHISVVVCSFFKFGTVSKWCIREWVKDVWVFFFLYITALASVSLNRPIRRRNIRPVESK